MRKATTVSQRENVQVRTEEMFKKNTHNEHEHKKTCLYPRDLMSVWRKVWILSPNSVFLCEYYKAVCSQIAKVTL